MAEEKTMLQRLLSYGNHHYATETDRKINSVTNGIALFFISVSFLVALIIIYFVYFILPEYSEVYDEYALYYVLLPSGQFFVISLSYWLKNRFGSNLIFVGLAGFYGLGYLSAFSMMLGPASGFFFYLYTLIPIPFFVLNQKQRRYVWISEIILAAVIISIIFWMAENAPLMGVPEQINEILWKSVLIFMIMTIFVCSYYFWHQSNRAEAELTSANEMLHHKDVVMQHELSLAADIQEGILPDDLSNWHDITMHSTFVPMTKVSGDYFDIFRHDDFIYLLQADISGHGVPAAFVTMAAKQAFSSLTNEKRSTAKIFAETNLQLLSMIKTQDYLTAFLIRIDRDYQMTYCNASHRQPLYYSRKKGEWSELDTDGLIIGALEESSNRYEEKSLQLEKGDRVHVFTDGLIEQRNDWREEFGVDRFTEILKVGVSEKLEVVHTRALDDVREFQGDMPQEDDVSLFSFELG